MFFILVSFFFLNPRNVYGDCDGSDYQCDYHLKYRRYDMNNGELQKYLQDKNYNKNYVSWNIANDFCKDSVGTKLAVLESFDDEYDAKEACSHGNDGTSGNYDCWIGLRSISDEFGRLGQENGNILVRKRNWFWNDKNDNLRLNDTNHTNWCDSEPSSAIARSNSANAGQENCVVLYEQCDYDWNDVNCTGYIEAVDRTVERVLCTNPDYGNDNTCLCNCNTCFIDGNSHITTFDNLLYHTQNKCSYKYISSCNSDFSGESGMPWEIIFKHISCFGGNCVDSVIVQFYDWNGNSVNRIETFHDGNGDYIRDENGNVLNEDTWYCTDNNFDETSACSNGRNSEVHFTSGIWSNEPYFKINVLFTDKQSRDHYDMTLEIPKMIWNDTSQSVKLHLSECWEDYSCGLCGNYDDDITNEFTLVDSAAHIQIFDDESSAEYNTSNISDFSHITSDLLNSQNTFIESWIDNTCDDTSNNININTDCYNFAESDCADHTSSLISSFNLDTSNNYYYGFPYQLIQTCKVEICTLSNYNYSPNDFSDYSSHIQDLFVHHMNSAHFPSLAPSKTPTLAPSPTCWPSTSPTLRPSETPTERPSVSPTHKPSITPSLDPTTHPTMNPSINPTTKPSNNPSIKPTNNPTHNPTILPTPSPTDNPIETVRCCITKSAFPSFRSYCIGRGQNDCKNELLDVCRWCNGCGRANEC